MKKAKKEKILHICSLDIFAKAFLLPEINHYIAKGFQVEIACKKYFNNGELSKNGYIVNEINIDRKINIISNIRTFIQLFSLIRIKKYDIVHTHNHVIGIIGRIAAKLAGVPRIVHSPHGFYFHENMKPSIYWFYHTLERFAALFTNIIFSDSLEDLEMARRTHLTSKEKLLYLGGGIDLKIFNGNKLDKKLKEKIQLEIGLDNKAFPVIGYCGRLNYEKGLNELIEAFKNVLEYFPHSQLLFIAIKTPGERDNFHGRLKKIINESELYNNVIITFRGDVPNLLSLLDIFTLPSYREGLPRSVMESMAMRIPVVGTNIRGTREEIQNGETGLLVPPRDSKALAQALLLLSKNGDMRKKLSANGRLFVEKNFRLDLMLDRFEKGYNKLILMNKNRQLK